MKQPERKYKYTHYTRYGYWEAIVTKFGVRLRHGNCATEREAAIQADRLLLENGFSPVNILKKL